MGGQLVQLFVGQCGVQVNNACWELLCVESGLDSTGKTMDTISDADQSSLSALFVESKSGRFVPRCVVIDSEPSVVDEIRMGIYRNLFDPSQLITGEEDSAANFARGYYRNWKLLMSSTLERIRHQAERCDELQGFFLHNAAGGGTGSSFPCALLEQLQDQYSKTARFQLAVAPSSALSSSTVEPYNALLGMHASMELVDCSILMDNSALIRLCTERLHLSKISMNTLNRIVAQIASGLFNTTRFDSELSTSVSSLLTNLVPYPAVHFTTGALAPLQGSGIGRYNTSSCYELTEQAFVPNNQILSCQADHPFVYLSCCLFYRGAVSVREANSAITKLKAIGQLPWVDWCPTGFKVAVTHQPITTIRESYISPVPCSVLSLHNSTVLLPSINRLVGEFNHLYQRRAFVHWFVGEGMEEHQFGQALSMLTDLRDLYKEFQTPEEFIQKPIDTNDGIRHQQGQMHRVSPVSPNTNELEMRNFSAVPFTSDVLGMLSPLDYSTSNTMKSDTLHDLNTTGVFGYTEDNSGDPKGIQFLSSSETSPMITLRELEQTSCDFHIGRKSMHSSGGHWMHEKTHKRLHKRRTNCLSQNGIMQAPKKHSSKRCHAAEGRGMRHIHRNKKKCSAVQSYMTKENSTVSESLSSSVLITDDHIDHMFPEREPSPCNIRSGTPTYECCTVTTSTPELPGQPSETTYVYF